MYYCTQSPFEAIERALQNSYSHHGDQHNLLQVVTAEHARVTQWRVNLQKLECFSSSALASHTQRWKQGNELFLRGLEQAFHAVSRDDDASLSAARCILKSGHDLLTRSRL
jgi:hypothetical protein